MILFGFPWLYGLVFGGLGLGYVMTPSDVPMSVYCWGTIAEPGTTAFMIIGVVSTLGLSTMTILVCFSMVALMRVRLFQVEQLFMLVYSCSNFGTMHMPHK